MATISRFETSTGSGSCITSAYNCWLIATDRPSHCYRCLLAAKFVFFAQKQDIKDANWRLTLTIVRRVPSFSFYSIPRSEKIMNDSLPDLPSSWVVIRETERIWLPKGKYSANNKRSIITAIVSRLGTCDKSVYRYRFNDVLVRLWWETIHCVAWGMYMSGEYALDTRMHVISRSTIRRSRNSTEVIISWEWSSCEASSRRLRLSAMTKCRSEQGNVNAAQLHVVFKAVHIVAKSLSKKKKRKNSSGFFTYKNQPHRIKLVSKKQFFFWKYSSLYYFSFSW